MREIDLVPKPKFSNKLFIGRVIIFILIYFFCFGDRVLNNFFPPPPKNKIEFQIPDSIIDRNVNVIIDNETRTYRLITKESDIALKLKTTIKY